MSYNFIPGIASQSLGAPGSHGIREKLEAAAAAGLKAVEIFEEDLNVLCQHVEEGKVPELRFTSNTRSQDLDDRSELKLVCARQIGHWCQNYGLQIICLQPFKFFEGLTDLERRRSRFEDLQQWMKIAECLGTDLIQIPSNFLSRDQCTGDRATIVADLRRAADMGEANDHKIRFAHEALCWGTHTDTWDAAWEIVEAVDRPNFGTCLDTFNIAGRVYADPESPSGTTSTAQADIKESIEKLRHTFSDPAKSKKIFYIELCDGERLQKPLDSTHEWYNPSQPARMTWSRNARLFPFETDSILGPDIGPGYLPVTQILDAILDVGYTGFVSFEVFSRTLHEEGQQVVAQHAERARISWERCAKYIDNYLEHKGQQDTSNFDLSIVDQDQDYVDAASQVNTVSSVRSGGRDEFQVHSRL